MGHDFLNDTGFKIQGQRSGQLVDEVGSGHSIEVPIQLLGYVFLFLLHRHMKTRFHRHTLPHDKHPITQSR